MAHVARYSGKMDQASKDVLGRFLTMEERADLRHKLEETLDIYQDQGDLLQEGVIGRIFVLGGQKRVWVGFTPLEPVEGDPTSFVLSITSVKRA